MAAYFRELRAPPLAVDRFTELKRFLVSAFRRAVHHAQ